jgi:hypothetical protein
MCKGKEEEKREGMERIPTGGGQVGFNFEQEKR